MADGVQHFMAYNITKNW